MTVEHDATASRLTIRVDRDKLLSHGKASLGRLLCRVHIWRCTANVKECTDFYENLSAVDGDYEEWRKVVCSKPEPRWKFVQPNTFLVREGAPEEVQLKVYDESNEGIVRSWAEREV